MKKIYKMRIEIKMKLCTPSIIHYFSNLLKLGYIFLVFNASGIYYTFWFHDKEYLTRPLPVKC